MYPTTHSAPEIDCGHCGSKLILPPKQAHLLAQSQQKGMRLLMLECQACGQYVDVDPMALTGAPARPAEPTWRRCPISGCTGWCVDISDVPAREPLRWGCGECGNTWTSDAELEAAISSAVKLHAHRADVYRRAGSAWHAVPLANEPADYEEKVEAESRPPLASFALVVSSAAMSLHDQIQSLVAKFAQDLEGLVRSAAVSAVQSALGAPPAVRAGSGSTATLASTPGPRSRAAAPPTVAAPTASKPRKATRVRRTAEQIEATANKIHAFVRANPNTSAEAIKKGLSIAKNEWLAPLSLLMQGKRLSSKGQKRATTYTAR